MRMADAHDCAQPLPARPDGGPMLDIKDAPKRATNLSLNSKLLDIAKELGINLSQTVDALLEQEVRRRLREQWLERNAGAIAQYNARIEREGTFSQQWRSFAKDER
jgi:antitoxin CcdA